MPAGGMASATVGPFGSVATSMPGAGGMGMGGMGMPGGMGMAMPGAAPGMQQAMAEPPEDMSCSAGPRAAAWEAAKQHFRGLLAPGKSAPQLASREAMSAAMEAALKELKAVDALGPQAADECGLGKLCLQLLSFATVDDPVALVQLFSGFEQLSSPVLTMLLDVPWAALAGAGWPFFGLLSQINLRRGHMQGALNTEAVDGLEEPANRAFQGELAAALAAADTAAVDKASSTYLQQETKGSALGPLTAMAAQASGSAPLQERLAMIQGLQIGFRQVIGNAMELDIAMGTQWPLWGLLHAAIEGLLA